MPNATETKRELVCVHCGAKGSQVIEKWVWVGGKGYVWTPQCLDREECWERYEGKANNGIR